MMIALFNLLAALLLLSRSPSARSFSLNHHLFVSPPPRRAVIAIVSPPPSSWCSTSRRRSGSATVGSRRRTRLHQSTPSNQDDDDGSNDSSSSSSNEERADGDRPDYASEETLLCVALAVRRGQTLDGAAAKVSKFCQSFPFAAVLPVQPLQYVPVIEDGGVEIKFLRKKTDLKSGIDGGVRFFIERPKTAVKDDATTTAAEDGEEDDDDDSDDDEPAIIEIKAKRNSRGQAISKLMSEKLIVTNFVAGITGEETSRFGEPPTDFVQVRSIYHKWM